MKRFKKFALLCALTGPAVIHLSCATALFQEARDQMLAGIGTVVHDTTIGVLTPVFTAFGG